MPIRLLLLEDDAAIAHTVCYALNREGFAVTTAGLVRDARALLGQAPAEPFAAALLDVGLPDGNGLDLCQDLRRQGSTLPIVMLTARGEELDRVLGLELGADDYVTKPFSPRELVARVRALLRRAATPPTPSTVQAPLFDCDVAGGRVRFAGHWLRLTRRELGLLLVLLRQPGRIWSRDALLDAVWGADADSTDRTVDTHIKTLRAKLHALRPDLDPIATHRGLGYAIDIAAS
jgi:two-component system, OmpR family, catabolic regulation response regulator CreB